MRTITLLASALAFAAATSAFAAVQDTAALDRRIANALGAEIGQPGGASAPIDPRLRLAQCPQPVTIDPPVVGALAVRCQALGWRIRVPLTRFATMPGGITQAAMAQAKPEPVIRRGDPVDLVAGSPSFQVSVAAVAQEDGAPGARIRVKTDGDGKPGKQIVFAEVIDAGKVRLPGFN